MVTRRRFGVDLSVSSNRYSLFALQSLIQLKTPPRLRPALMPVVVEQRKLCVESGNR